MINSVSETLVAEVSGFLQTSAAMAPQMLLSRQKAGMTRKMLGGEQIRRFLMEAEEASPRSAVTHRALSSR
jgi:hypothetical protein